MGERQVAAASANLHIDADGVVHNVLTGAAVDLPDVHGWERAYATLSGGPPAPVVVDIRAFTAVTASARKYAASAEHGAAIEAVALIVGSPVSRVIGNFWLGIDRPPYPARLFTDPEAAQRWLVARRG